MLREFTDSEGNEWRVWDVNPLIHDRRTQSGKRPGFIRVPESWLCFQSGDDRRRLTPVPAGWIDMDDAQLESLCDRAESAPMNPHDSEFFDTLP